MSAKKKQKKKKKKNSQTRKVDLNLHSSDSY